jgi:hypothetical protein
MKRILPLMLAFLAACGDGGTTGPDPDPVLVATTSLPEGLVGASYSVALAASGGTGSYGWSVSSGTLPPGLTLAAGGTISGTPSAPGTSSFTVRATSGTLSGTRDLSITIQAPEVVITTSALAGGSAGAAYSQTLAATGGTGVFTWTVLGGALPAGLSLSHGGRHQQLHGAGCQWRPHGDPVAVHHHRQPGGRGNHSHAAGRHGWHGLWPDARGLRW